MFFNKFILYFSSNPLVKLASIRFFITKFLNINLDSIQHLSNAIVINLYQSGLLTNLVYDT